MMIRNNTAYFYHFDGLGSVTNIIDINGNIVESYSYDEYGKPNQTSAIGNPYYFTGRELDQETGLYYYRAYCVHWLLKLNNSFVYCRQI